MNVLERLRNDIKEYDTLIDDTLADPGHRTERVVRLSDEREVLRNVLTEREARIYAETQENRHIKGNCRFT